jgi:hypothetical protein
MTKSAPISRVGLFLLDLPGLLRNGFIRAEPVGADGQELRLRFVRMDDGHFYIQARQDGPRLRVDSEDQ